MPDSSFDMMLEKLSIINHLFDRDIELYLHYGKERDLLKTMWGGKYKDEEGSINERYK